MLSLLANFSASTPARLLAAAAFLLALAWLYRRRGLRIATPSFALLALTALALFALWPPAALLGLLLVFAAHAALAVRSRRAQPYTAAMARIEGGGVKRGLTPPEAAVLLGRPLKLTLTLVLFEMLRKGFLRQTAAWPLALEVAPAFKTHGKGLTVGERGERRRQAAQAIPAALHPYEEAFLEILEEQSGQPAAEVDYSIAIQPLVRYVASRVGGFDLAESQDYYRLIIERAPKEARSDGVLTFEREKVFDRNFGWVLLGPDFRAVLDADDYAYTPVWLRTTAPDLNGKTFAAWAADVIDSMEDVVAEEEVALSQQSESDLLTATLMNQIARATFYG